MRALGFAIAAAGFAGPAVATGAFSANAQKFVDYLRKQGRKLHDSITGQGVVAVPCAACQKFIAGYIADCAAAEASFRLISSLSEFCENSYATGFIGHATFSEQDHTYCRNLAAVLAARTGTASTPLSTANHVPGACAELQRKCNEDFGGAPDCYSGFCDELAECVDCPYAYLTSAGAAVAVDARQLPDAKICADRGVCRVPRRKSRTGFCDCKNYRGVACDQISPAALATEPPPQTAANFTLKDRRAPEPTPGAIEIAAEPQSAEPSAPPMPTQVLE